MSNNEMNDQENVRMSEANDQPRTHGRAMSEANDQPRTHGRAMSEANDQPRRERWDCGQKDNKDAWWEDRSLVAKVFIGIGFAIFGVGFAALLIFVVMSLWNWLMPEIFGLGSINYWKAAGLMALCFILFKSWGSGGSNRRSDRKRKRHLRHYMQEDGPAVEGDPADSPQT